MTLKTWAGSAAAFLKTCGCTVLHLVYPSICVCCQKPLAAQPYQPVCALCMASILPVTGNTCAVCGEPLPRNGHCRLCRATVFMFDQALSACFYSSPVISSCIRKLKYNGALRLAPLLGSLTEPLFSRLPEVSADSLVTAVPLHWTRFRERGYNQAALLAASIAGGAALPADFHILVRRRNTKPQTQLTAEARRRNLENAFRCVQPQRVYKKTVLVVDDVFTTGATLNACAGALKDAGARRVIGLTVAR